MQMLEKFNFINFLLNVLYNIMNFSMQEKRKNVF